MTRPTRLEINCETGEELIIELTDAEIAQMEADAAEFAARQHEAEVKAAEEAATKEVAHAKLAALGLTTDEIAALFK
jgi:hypothetical protein